MNWLSRMIECFATGRKVPTADDVAQVVAKSERQRARTRPIIDRAHRLADAYARGDLALRGK